MSKAVAATLPIGPVQIYWNDVRMGSPMSQANIRYTKNTVQAGLEDAGVNVISHKTNETCEVDVTIADFKISQLRYVYDAATEFAATSVLATNNYDASTSTTIRHREDHELSGTANITLDTAAFLTGTINVFSSDWSSDYVRGTDFTANSTAGTVARITGGSITDGDSVHIEFNAATTVALIGVGGQMADFEANLKLVHELDNGKKLQFHAFRAKKIGATDTAIQMAAAFGGQAMTFHVLADMTKVIGKQLFEWAVEA